MCRSRRQDSTNAFMNSTPTDYQFVPPSSRPSSTHYDVELSQTRKAETNHCIAAERHNQVLQEVITMEVKLGISRWQPADVQYIETLKYMSERNYHKTLGNLQRLVIQRLFELNRLNLARTGMLFIQRFMLLFPLIPLVQRLSHANPHRQVIANSLQGHSERSQGIQCCCACIGSSSA
jgi:hypothetical protein